MLPIVSWQASLLLLVIMFLFAMVATRVVQPAWWQSRPVRIGIFVATFGILAGITIYAVGHATHNHAWVLSGCGLTYLGILVLGPAAIAAPVGAGLDRALSRMLLRKRVPAEVPAREKTGLSRRALIRAGGGALPALGALAGVDGFVSAKQAPKMPIVRFAYEGLHPDLEGLRILHLSDIHLGGSISLDDLQKGLDAAFAAGHPDLVVVTGDIADDRTLLKPAMERVALAAAKYGAFASLGNHEYLHDIRVTRPLLESSPVPLLVSNGRTVNIGRARLFIGGADDPMHMHGDIAHMLRPSIEKVAAHAPRDADFRLLLCHRPEGLGPAADTGFDLVLSGHTHGGQLGLFGRSLLEKVRPGIGWWGRYERARPVTPAARVSRLASTPTRLYTSSGFGHWFPFRVGCPTEMPVVVLEGAPARNPRMTTVSRRA